MTNNRPSIAKPVRPHFMKMLVVHRSTHLDGIRSLPGLDPLFQTATTSSRRPRLFLAGVWERPGIIVDDITLATSDARRLLSLHRRLLSPASAAERQRHLVQECPALPLTNGEERAMDAGFLASLKDRCLRPRLSCT